MMLNIKKANSALLFFYFIGGILLSMIVGYVFLKESNQNINLISKSLQNSLNKKGGIHFIDVKGPIYYPSIGNLSVNVINLDREPLIFDGSWMYMIKDTDGRELCRAFLSLSKQTEDISLVSFDPPLEGPNKDIFPGMTQKTLNIALTPKCKDVLNQSMQANKKVQFVLYIAPSSASDFVTYAK